MNLAFKLLVIDDNPTSIDGAIRILEDYLDRVGFSLDKTVANDLSEYGIKQLARYEGREYDLVVVDYNLGRMDTNGAVAAAGVRRQLPYTDIIFYSTDQSANLLEELAKQGVAGVFVAGRQELDDALKGLAETLIRKVIDLNHMRGIAMAEVAEMDVLMEACLESVFSSEDAEFMLRADETLEKLLQNTKERLKTLENLVEGRRILDILGDSQFFDSAKKYMAIRRVAKCLPKKPTSALSAINDYPVDVIKNRNTLAHAKEDRDGNGNASLRSIKRGQAPVVIDENWMIDFRGKLRKHRDALTEICSALNTHLNALVTSEAEKDKADLLRK